MNALTRQELDGLITALLEGGLEEAEHARLEGMLREDYECRRHYLMAVDQHARLLMEPGIASGRPAARAGAGPATVRKGGGLWRGIAAAAVLLLLAGMAGLLWMAPRRGALTLDAPAEQEGRGCAVLAQTLNARFADESPLAGAMLSPGVVRLESGLAQIEFFSGATVLLEGPAELEIVSAWEAACHAGKARVRVPPPAQGFRLQAPEVKLVDLGTEFAVEVAEGGAAHVKVFEGEVEAYPKGGEMRLLSGGESFSHGGSGGGAQPAVVEFTSIQQFDTLRAGHAQARHDEWWRWFQETRTDARLIACYAFKHWKDDRWDRLVNNFTEPKAPGRAGAAVGCRWTQGRWPVKDALEFRGPGDRVRINLGEETYAGVTLACWVRVDALDRKYNALLLTDGYEPGEPHWQIYEDGRLMFSIAYEPPAQRGDVTKKRNQIYYSPPLFNLSNQRRWRHIAVTYDGQTGEAAQYLDGREVSRERSAFHQPGRPISFGPCEIGNWGLPTEGHQFPIRNLNGCLDEMLIYGVALNAAELKDIYLAGRPE